MSGPGMERPGPARDCLDLSWDVIVIGAGPAGALAAYLLAKHSLRTLLVEKAEFPRAKVCGGCVNLRALDALQRVGLGALCDQFGTHRSNNSRCIAVARQRRSPCPRVVRFRVRRLMRDWLLMQLGQGPSFYPLRRQVSCPVMLRAAVQGRHGMCM